MKKTFFFLAFLLCLTLVVNLATVFAKDKVYLDISSSKTRKISFAVPWFVNKDLPSTPQNFGRDLADVLAKSLKFHGIISILPTSQYGGKQNANFRSLGVDYSILGNYTINSDSVKLELRLVEASSGQMLMGKSYQGKTNQKEDMLFKFCDKAIYELTGKNGIASTQIAIISSTKNAKEVFLTNILGTTLRQITRHRSIVVSPRFTQDGSHLSYTSFHTKKQNLYITDLRQSKTTRALSRRKGMNLAPAWSPDGKNMIITLSHKGNPDLYLLDRTGNIIEQLTKNSGLNVSASWSPDGQKIVFVSDRSGKPQLYLMDFNNRRTQRLTFEGTENAEPSWSPTESLITYSSLRDGIYQIFTVIPDPDATPTQITSDGTNHETPSWSPDGNQIIFAKRDGKVNRIYGVMKNGSFQRQLFAFPGSQTYPQWSYKY